MSLDILGMWVGSVITVYLYSQVAALAGWLMIHFRSIATRRERVDTSLAFAVSLAFITVQLIWSFRGMVSCDGLGLEIASDAVAFGAGLYLYRSLYQRHRFYLFATQEARRHKSAAVPT